MFPARSEATAALPESKALPYKNAQSMSQWLYLSMEPVNMTHWGQSAADTYSYFSGNEPRVQRQQEYESR